jgi:sarcosine oxidase, subunit beta
MVLHSTVKRRPEPCPHTTDCADLETPDFRPESLTPSPSVVFRPLILIALNVNLRQQAEMQRSMQHVCDVLIAGAGIMGCSLAYELAREGVDVALLDRGAVCAGSSAVNAGGVRQQFSHDLNVRLAKRSIDRIVTLTSQWGVDIGFHQVGYLFLVATEEHEQAFRQAIRLQNSWDVPSRYLDIAEIAVLVPGIRTDDLRGGAFCPTDGYLDPYALVSGYAAAARRAGAEIRTNTPVIGVETGGNRVTAVLTAGGDRYLPHTLVNAAGVWAPTLARLYGGDLPIVPWRSQNFVVDRIPDFGSRLPMTVDFDHGKAYFHGEGPGILAGMDNETAGTLAWDVPCDWKKFTQLAERLAHRVPALESAEVTRGWAGFLEITPDDNPLVGWTDLDNVYTAAGFSGHGFSIAPGLAPEVAREVRGLPATIPLDAYRPGRFAAGANNAGGVETLALR